MQRVLFISRKWPPAIGGMETYAVKLTERLAQRCILETRVLPGRAHGAKPALPSLLAFLVGSLAYLLRRRADVVHVGDLVLWPLAWAARWFRTAPRVAITAYGLDVIYGRRHGILPRTYAFYLALGARMVGRKAKIVAISHATARLCREAGFEDVSVVTLGVDPPLATVPEALPADPFVLFVGRLVRRKGAAWFAREVLPLLPNGFRMVVVGKTWDADEEQALTTDSRVEYLGVVGASELFTLRRQATAVIMPNIHTGGIDMEGFGLAAVEAAADGGVLLASGIEGIVDAVVDGGTGFLLPTGDARAWAARIEQVNAWTPSDRASFIEASQRLVRQRYTWDVVADRTLLAYADDARRPN